MKFKTFLENIPRMLLESDEGLTVWKKDKFGDWYFYAQYEDELVGGKPKKVNRVDDVPLPKSYGKDIRMFYRKIPASGWDWQVHHTLENLEREKTHLIKKDLEDLGGEQFFRDNVVEIKYDLKHADDALVTVVLDIPDIKKAERFKDVEGDPHFQMPISNVYKPSPQSGKPTKRDYKGEHSERGYKWGEQAYVLTQWDKKQKDGVKKEEPKKEEPKKEEPKKKDNKKSQEKLKYLNVIAKDRYKKEFKALSKKEKDFVESILYKAKPAFEDIPTEEGD